MQKVLKVIAGEWNAQAAFWLLDACDDTYTLDALAYDVQRGACSVFHVFDGQIQVAAFVLRLDGIDLVVVAAGGYLPHSSLYELITPYVEKLARENGAKFLRGHTDRRGVGRLMENAGWQLSEYVYRKEVAHGR